MHKRNMFLHTVEQMFNRYGILVTREMYDEWLRDGRYDTANRIADAKGGRWYQRIKHDNKNYYAIVSNDGVHTILSKKIVKKDLGLRSLK